MTPAESELQLTSRGITGVLREDVAERVVPHRRPERVHQRARAEQEHRVVQFGELPSHQTDGRPGSR
jgi:hypothetical protein